MRVMRCNGWAVLAVVLLVFPVMAATGGSPARAAAPPNILLIVTDDQDSRSLTAMPNVRQLLRRQGMRFANFFVADPHCCPSRASILRGQYVHSHGVLRGSGKDGGFDRFLELGHEASTVATWLHDAGYRTALLGKYLNEYPDGADPAHVPPGWDDWYGLTLGRYFGYTLNENGQLVDYGNQAEDYETDVLSRTGVDLIEQAAAAGSPFFLYVAPNAPHGPATPAPRHAKKYRTATAPRVSSFNETDVSDKPAFVRDAPKLSSAAIEAIDNRYRNRLRTLAAVDELVRDLIATMEATGTLDNTYVLFTSDNGYLLGEHRRTDKAMPYEEAIRVPLLVRGPGVAPRRVEQALASNTDLAPTIAELAGVAPPNFTEGRSLAPWLRGDQPAAWRQAVLVEYFSEAPEDTVSAAAVVDLPRVPTFQLLRTPDRVYVEYTTGERELYDLGNDPRQLQSLADHPDHTAEVERLSAWLGTLTTCTGAGCREAEATPPTDNPQATRTESRDDGGAVRSRGPDSGSTRDGGGGDRAGRGGLRREVKAPRGGLRSEATPPARQEAQQRTLEAKKQEQQERREAKQPEREAKQQESEAKQQE